MKKTSSKMDIYSQLRRFPEQLQDALSIKIPGVWTAGSVCVCGMGASALAGDVLSDFCNDRSNVPIGIIRDVALPGWVGKDTTVIAVSYSGNTKEVLFAYEEARRRGASIIAITSGGELSKKCKSHGNVLVAIPEGFVSRGAMGYLIGSLAMVLQTLGVGTPADALKSLLARLKKYRDKMTSNSDKTVKNITAMILGNVPVIYSLANMNSSAIRWKTQIDENSKILAFCGSIPEFNHNEIVGWIDDIRDHQLFLPVILYDDDASKMVRAMMDTSIDIMSDKGIKLIVYHVWGRNNLEKNLKCMILGDLVSICLAKSNSTDPEEDRPVIDTNRLVIVDDADEAS